jgi:glutamate-1-semialdehyde 2,1-aminomutase
MVFMEPINCNGGCCPPRPGYLEKVRELCTRYGIVFCFDEVITGFRVGLNCAQGQLGVTPDISTFRKALAGGVPMGAVAGNKEIMDLLLERRVIGAGTFNGYPLGIAASLASLRILEKENGAYYKEVDRLQNRLMNGLKEMRSEHKIPTLIQGPRGVFFYQFIHREWPIAFVI